MEAAILKARSVDDSHCINGKLVAFLAVRINRENRAQGLNAIKDSGCIAADDFDAFFWTNREYICLANALALQCLASFAASILKPNFIQRRRSGWYSDANVYVVCE